MEPEDKKGGKLQKETPQTPRFPHTWVACTPSSLSLGKSGSKSNVLCSEDILNAPEELGFKVTSGEIFFAGARDAPVRHHHHPQPERVP